jgi:hypothetical protein
MGTRSLTTIIEGDKPLCHIYAQYDGYPTGHGADLAKLCDLQIINGFGTNQIMGTAANGMGCLAAQVIAGLKTTIGAYYLVSSGADMTNIDYRYIISGTEGSKPIIECRSDDKKIVFKGTSDEWYAFLEKDES